MAKRKRLLQSQEKNRSMHAVIGFCEKHLPDRATQKQIRLFLSKMYPERAFSDRWIRDIRKELGNLRKTRLEKTVNAFKGRFPHHYNAWDVDDFFSANGLSLTRKEKQALLKRTPKMRLNIRIGKRYHEILEAVSQTTGFSVYEISCAVFLTGMVQFLTSLEWPIQIASLPRLNKDKALVFKEYIKANLKMTLDAIAMAR